MLMVHLFFRIFYEKHYYVSKIINYINSNLKLQVSNNWTLGQTHLISVQRSEGVFLLKTDWLFEGL